MNRTSCMNKTEATSEVRNLEKTSTLKMSLTPEEPGCMHKHIPTQSHLTALHPQKQHSTNYLKREQESQMGYNGKDEECVQELFVGISWLLLEVSELLPVGLTKISAFLLATLLIILPPLLCFWGEKERN